MIFYNDNDNDNDTNKYIIYKDPCLVFNFYSILMFFDYVATVQVLVVDLPVAIVPG